MKTRLWEMREELEEVTGRIRDQVATVADVDWISEKLSGFEAWSATMDILNDRGQPNETRKAAGMKMIEYYGDKKDVNECLQISGNSDPSKDKCTVDYPESVRIAAGMKALEILEGWDWKELGYGYIDRWADVCKTSSRPLAVRTAAKKTFKALAAKRISNTIADDGVLSQGTVKPPAADVAKNQPGGAMKKIRRGG